MNMFANIVVAIRFKKITYYSIKFENEKDPIFIQFFNNHKGADHNEPISIIRSWLKKLGEEIGADTRYFRPEAAAHALPPPARYIHVDCSLRLYCMRINERAVILFNGAEKTAQTAQECDNVRPHFTLANQLTQVIDQAIIDGDIQFSENDDLIFEPTLTLEI